MKNLILLLLVLLFFACGKATQEMSGDFSTMAFSLDTVMVDPGEEILFLKWGLHLSDLSADKRFLYNFNMDQHLLEKIDLEALELIDLYGFEKEGPNGVGRYISRLVSTGEEEFLITTFDKSGTGIYSIDGERIKRIDLKPSSLSGDELKDDESLNQVVVSGNNQDMLYGLFSNWLDGNNFLGIINVADKSFRRLEFPEFDKLKKYYLRLNNENGMPIMMAGPSFYLHLTDSKVYISNSVDNGTYIFDIDMDSLFFKKIDNRLFATAKKGNYQEELDSKEEFDREWRAFQEEINFQNFVWDKDKEVFYRFAYEEFQNDNSEEEEGEVQTKANVYLSMLDKDLNVLHESKVAQLNKRPAYHFVKDGKIWIFENVEDELGFVRLAIAN